MLVNLLRYLELMDRLARNAKVCAVNDLETIGYLRRIVQTPKASVGGFTSTLLKLTQLNINLRLPLSFYESLDSSSILDNSTSELPNTVQTWLHIASTIIQLRNLTRLRIWLDHDDQCRWTVVNERALLQPLTPLFHSENLDISISLPKLYPSYEREERHFIQETPTPFQLYRRFR